MTIPVPIITTHDKRRQATRRGRLFLKQTTLIIIQQGSFCSIVGPVSGGATVQILNTPEATWSGIYLDLTASLTTANATISGNFTGKKYIVSGNSYLTAKNPLPGSQAGVAQNGGLVVLV